MRYKDKIYSFNQTPQNEGLPLPPEQEVGYLSVSVFTASGALPVQGALVTVYIIDESGVENEIVHHVTDANGKIPLITLPVIYDRFDPDVYKRQVSKMSWSTSGFLSPINSTPISLFSLMPVPLYLYVLP